MVIVIILGALIAIDIALAFILLNRLKRVKTALVAVSDEQDIFLEWVNEATEHILQLEERVK